MNKLVLLPVRFMIYCLIALIALQPAVAYVGNGNLSVTTNTLGVSHLTSEDHYRDELLTARAGYSTGSSPSINTEGEPISEGGAEQEPGQVTWGLEGHQVGHDRTAFTHATIGQGQLKEASGIKYHIARL